MQCSDPAGDLTKKSAPVEHGVHCGDPAGANVFTGQIVHDDAPGLLVCPAPQGEQVDPPYEFAPWKYPLEHGVQLPESTRLPALQVGGAAAVFKDVMALSLVAKM